MLSAEEVKQLKAKIKAEMLRRNKTGSLASYGSASYDFNCFTSSALSITTLL